MASKALVNSHRPLDEEDVLAKKKGAPWSRYSQRDSLGCEDHESESLLNKKKRQQGLQIIPLSPLSSSDIYSSIESGQASNPMILRNHSSNAIGNTSLNLNDSPELQSIKPAFSKSNVSPSKLRGGQSSTSVTSHVSICSARSCCGADPVRMSLIVLTIVTLWSIIIFCINLQKQVVIHRGDLGALQDEVHKLEDQNTELRKENALINSILSKIASLHSKARDPISSQSLGPLQSAAPATGTGSSGKSHQKDSERNGPHKKDKICTASGQSCVFPFMYKDVVHRSCVKEWSYPRPWCATKVDENGRYVSGDSSSWSDCLPSCRH